MTSSSRRAALPHNPPVTIEFRGFARPIVARLDRALARELPLLLSSWPRRRVDPARRWHLCVAPEAGGCRLSERKSGRKGKGEVYPSAAEAMSAFIGALIAAALRQTRDTICLHAGGAVLPSGAILLLGASFAGKSSVAMHLAAGGALFFGDDRIAVADDRALALGLAPKLRLPIPDDAGPVFTRFARARVRSTRWGVAHLRLQRGEAAAFGRRARVRAIVVLKRRDDGPARLVTADRSTAMRSLVAHAFAPQMAAAALVARLAALTSRVPAYTLEFSRSREAARVLWHLGNHG